MSVSIHDLKRRVIQVGSAVDWCSDHATVRKKVTHRVIFNAKEIKKQENILQVSYCVNCYT